MIRVLQFGMSDNYGGIEAFIMNYYRALDRTKIQFDFAKSNRDIKLAYEDEILKLGGKIYYTPVIGLKSGYHALKKAWIDFYSSIKVDEIHFNTVALMNMYAIRFAKQAGIHVHVHAHPSTYDSDFSCWIKARVLYNRKAVHKYADTLLACSDDAGRWMFGSGYKVIPNSIDCEKFRFNGKVRKEIREKYGLNNSFVMLHIGRLSVVKNQIFLLRVLQEVKKEKPNAKLLLVGLDVLNGAIQKKAKEMGLGNDVIFPGMVREPEAFYSASDIFLFPSLSEGFGIAPIEAQANGLRVIVSDKLVDTINATGTVRYLSIGDNRHGAASELWAFEIISNYERLKREEIKPVYFLYDIHSSVKELEEIYLKYE